MAELEKSRKSRTFSRLIISLDYSNADYSSCLFNGSTGFKNLGVFFRCEEIKAMFLLFIPYRGIKFRGDPRLHIVQNSRRQGLNLSC